MYLVANFPRKCVIVLLDIEGSSKLLRVQKLQDTFDI